MKPTQPIRNRFLLAGDLLLIVTSVLASFALRLDLGPTFVYFMPQAWLMVGLALLVKPTIYYFFGLYRRYWAYASVRELRLIAVATVAAEVVVALMLMLAIVTSLLPATFPRSVIFIDWLFSLFSVGGLRLTVRLIAEAGQVSQKSDGRGGMRRVVIVGAGDAGVLVVREMQRNPQLHMVPAAFVDDDPEKLRKDIHGVRVAGTLRDLSTVIDRARAREVVIAIPSAPGEVVRIVTQICRRKGIPFRTMPGIYELIGGKVNVSRLRDVDISDLLRRQPARIDDEVVGRTLTGKRVLVTGAGGSIGLELCRQVARWMPAQLILLGHGENSIFEALLELGENFPELPMLPVVADVRDAERITQVFEQTKPEVVFHAAAHKHVPLMELNVPEAVTNNVLGTRRVVEAALASGTSRLVLISTDKAVQPASIMGATKAMAELIVRDAAQRARLPYVSVRFGNVLGSRGSIVPLFKRQIARGGPVTITHPEMKRYFMTIPEAVHLVLQAAGLGSGGEVFVLRMGEQVPIVDLAEDLIRLSGFEPGKEIEVQFTGIRPGEKLEEALWDEGMQYATTTHPDVVRVEDTQPLANEALASTLAEMDRLAREGDAQALLALLAAHLPGNQLGQAPPPEITSVV
ncbi:MAG: polysaccharide biosynthesis protein [Chloroflexi bacterium]|nr:polysaccharide biosynthesis protein [Chloroflexota bacterium]